MAAKRCADDKQASGHCQESGQDRGAAQASQVREIKQERFRWRLAQDAADLRAIGQMRRAAFFRQSRGETAPALDLDRFDETAMKVLVEPAAGGEPVASLRVMLHRGWAEARRGYCARFYEFSGLSRNHAPLLEVGRLCTHHDLRDADALRVAFGALLAIAEAAGAGFLFGCTTFWSQEPGRLLPAFAYLRDHALAPAYWRVRARGPDHLPLSEAAGTPKGGSLLQVPPLLRSYLAMGARVGPEAVPDDEMGTVHVFTGLETARIAPARLRFLRRGAQAGPHETIAIDVARALG